MSSLLQHLKDDFDRRMTLRRRMLSHLDIVVPDTMIVELRPEIRETLKACQSCGNPEICEGWIDQNRPGAPMFCRARECFLRLDAACRMPVPERLSA